MKKLIAALFAAVLMAAGLVVATTSTASANCFPSQYQGCVQTRTHISGPATVFKKRKAKICAVVDARRSNAQPTGTVVITVKRNAGGYFFKAVLPYGGGEVCAKTDKLRLTGGYTAVAKYKSPKGSVFINSRDSMGFDVIPRR